MVIFARECTAKGTHDGKKKRDSFYQHQEAGKQEKNQMGLLKMKRQIMHFMAISSSVIRSTILAYIQAVRTREAQLWDSVGKPLYSRFTKTNDFKGVPHPLSGDYTPTPQEEIDESLYVYGKKGPQEPEPNVSDDRSSEYSTCQSNDSAGSIGTSSEHSVDPESEISSVPPEVYMSTPKTTNEKGTSQTPNSNASEEKDEDVELIVVPSAVKITEEKVESRTSSKNSKKEEILTEPQQEKKAFSTDTSEDNPKILAFRRELEEITLKHLGIVPENNSTGTPSVNTGSQTVNTGRLNHDDSPMPELKIFHKSETGIFDEASYDEEGVITNFNSLPTEIEVSPTPTLRIHNIHPKSQILGDPKSVVQTRSKVQQKSGAHALFSFIQKQQRNNHKVQHHCLFACFLSQEEPKKISEALQDEDWVQAMQEELLQFKLQQVWVLVDLPHGMKVIGTKWVYKNKRDERGVVVRNKARLVAQGYTQEEGIDYDEVFAPVAKATYMVLLKVHRHHNMYSFDMRTPTPAKSFACLIAKATSNKSRMWHRSWVFFLASKDETSGILQNFIRQIENQLNHRVKIIRSNNDTEFKNRDMLEFCGNKGIKQEYSNARIPQQNGVAKRMNRTLIEAARTMLANSLLPTTFWAEAVSTACYIFNRNQTNSHAGTSEVTNSAGTSQTPNSDASKEKDKDAELIVMPSTVMNTEENVESRKSSTNSKKEEILTEPQQEKEAFSTDTLEDNPKILAFRRELEEIALKHLRTVSENNSTNTPLVNFGSELVNTGQLDPDNSPMPELEIFHKSETGIFDEASYDEEGEEPKKISEALQDDSWVQAMQEELLQFKLQQVWVLVDLPHGMKEEGIDYDEVFAPVARIEAIRLFLAFASFMGFIVYQMDVKSAFLYDTINEEVYVLQPPGFVDPDRPKKVYKVVKALYGLHQAPRAWYATLSILLEKHGYKRGTIDNTLFIKRDKKDIMLVQVFQMSSMGELTFFLGLQVKQNKEGIFISQDKYVAEILKKFDLVSVKTAITPMETKVALTKDEEAVDVDVHLYRSMICSLMYLTASRPDIMFAICACSRFQVTPKTLHLNAVKRIFKYLKGKPNLGLWYPRESPFDLEAFSDSNYSGSKLDRKSTTGGCQFLGQRLISWQCKKQTIVATSTTEAEYVAAANCCGQVLWVQNQLLDYGFNFMNTKIHIDNESTICIMKNPVYHSKTKHIEIRHHFIRDCYEKKLISVEKIHTDLNVADLLTKPFDGPRFNFLVVSIGMINP
ncbi:putative ribonuclease H-like domain-containing protein [Tanacetum coccineum]